MFAIITTEEYKELLLAKADAETCPAELSVTREELKGARAELAELLLMLVKNEASPQWDSRKYEWYDLERSENIVEYINRHYVKNGILQFNKIKENTNE